MKEIIDDPDSSKLYMVLEYCENGEIHWKDEEGSPALSVGEIRRIFRDTLLGLEYCQSLHPHCRSFSVHHQGIIHRDIKPSNLLLAGSGVVKISDFGCSHYSEALRVASAQSGSEGEEYIGDVELAKTAGSPAFFAPEMCYSGLENDFGPRRSLSPPISTVQEIPALTLRPPSVVEDHVETNSSRSDPLVTSPGGRTFPLKPTLSNDSSLSRRPDPARTHSSSTIQQRERLPMTNAIDVWALGVTLYCLLFGKTPFDAPNEYLLMQVIPTADFEIPPFMGKDRMQTGRQGGLRESEEATECLDLLRRLLEKDPGKRISPEQAKVGGYLLP
jgi:serine/threonine protein kinase